MSAPSAIRPTRSAPSTARKSKPANDSVGDESRQTETPPRSVSGFNGNRRVPTPVNETIKSYAPASPGRAALKERLRAMSGERIEFPLIIGGDGVRYAQASRPVRRRDS